MRVLRGPVRAGRSASPGGPRVSEPQAPCHPQHATSTRAHHGSCGSCYHISIPASRRGQGSRSTLGSLAWGQPVEQPPVIVTCWPWVSACLSGPFPSAGLASALSGLPGPCTAPAGGEGYCQGLSPPLLFSGMQFVLLQEVLSPLHQGEPQRFPTRNSAGPGEEESPLLQAALWPDLSWKMSVAYTEPARPASLTPRSRSAARQAGCS